MKKKKKKKKFFKKKKKKFLKKKKLFLMNQNHIMETESESESYSVTETSSDDGLEYENQKISIYQKKGKSKNAPKTCLIRKRKIISKKEGERS